MSSMASPEHSPNKAHPPTPQAETVPILEDIERQLERADEIENTIERTREREKLLELLDMLDEQ
jgi:hypothetical protein